MVNMKTVEVGEWVWVLCKDGLWRIWEVIDDFGRTTVILRLVERRPLPGASETA